MVVGEGAVQLRADRQALKAVATRIRGVPAGLAVLLVGLFLASCTETKAFLSAGEIDRPARPLRVLLMPPDVELFELTAGGLQEPNAQWTETAKSHVAAALEQILREKNAELVAYGAPEGDSAEHNSHSQLIKLHGAVGQAVLLHKYGGQQLPTKEDKFDWSLGPGVEALGEDYGADFVLFIYLRDSYATPARMALFALAVLQNPFNLFGGPGGVQAGFASLVDLRSGDVVWFNRLIRETGDLREADSARAACEKLLAEFPL